MEKYVFITDTHLITSVPFRVGDSLQDCLDKITYVIDYANRIGARILIGGDVFDKSTIPYEAYTKVCKVFRTAAIPPLVIRGNHDQLFRCNDNDYKTTLQNAIELGLFELLDGTIETQECFITSDKCLVNREKPQIFMFHGFLNIKDGKHTVTVEDFSGVTTPTVALLGHDHVEYEPVELGSVTIYRIGSLFRNRRVETSDRNPKFLELSISGGVIETSSHEIPAKDVTSIFREVAGKADKTTTVDYDTILSDLKSVSSDKQDFSTVVSSVATSRVAEYIVSLTENYKISHVN